MASATFPNYDPIQSTLEIAPLNTKTIEFRARPQPNLYSISIQITCVSDNKNLVRSGTLEFVSTTSELPDVNVTIPSADFMPVTYVPGASPTIYKYSQSRTFSMDGLSISRSDSLVPIVSSATITTSFTSSIDGIAVRFVIANTAATPIWIGYSTDYNVLRTNSSTGVVSIVIN